MDSEPWRRAKVRISLFFWLQANLRLIAGNAGSSALKQALLASPRAHLLHLYPILLDIATYSGPGHLPKIWVATRNGPTGDDRQPHAAKDIKDAEESAAEASDEESELSDDAVEVDARAVAKACLKALSKDVGF